MKAVQPYQGRLIKQWKKRARMLAAHGAVEAAKTYERVAVELEREAARANNELLSLSSAAHESGYSTDHLSRLVREGKLRNFGKKHRPLVQRSELPLKGGWSAGEYGASEGKSGTSEGYNQVRLLRDIANSKFGGCDVKA
jgi:hypothetical protein